MKRQVGIFILFCFLFNSSLMTVICPATVAALSTNDVPACGVLAQADRVVNSVKALVTWAVPLYPEYKPLEKTGNNQDLGQPVVVSPFLNLQKHIQNSSKLVNYQNGRFQARLSAAGADVGSSQAPPGSPPGGWVLLFVLLYIISLNRSNLPAVIAFSCGSIRPITQ